MIPRHFSILYRLSPVKNEQFHSPYYLEFVEFAKSRGVERNGKLLDLLLLIHA